MNDFDNDPVPFPVAQLSGAYWLAPRVHDEAGCVWCVQLREADERARRRAAREGKRSPAVWVVAPGLPPRPAVPGRAQAGCRDSLAGGAQVGAD
ncbi:hypothetical protein ACWCXB_30655 [Streptomyces sp. NPDC001514]